MGLMLPRMMTSPITKPMIVQMMTARIIPMIQFWPQLTLQSATRTVVSDMNEPVARLMEPVTMQNIRPTPQTPMMADCLMMVRKLLTVKKFLLPIVNPTASSAMTMTIV